MTVPRPVKERTLHTACLVPEVDPKSFGSAKTHWRTNAQHIQSVLKVANYNSSFHPYAYHSSALSFNLTITGEIQRMLIEL